MKLRLIFALSTMALLQGCFQSDSTPAAWPSVQGNYARIDDSKIHLAVVSQAGVTTINGTITGTMVGGFRAGFEGCPDYNYLVNSYSRDLSDGNQTGGFVSTRSSPRQPSCGMQIKLHPDSIDFAGLA